MKWEIMELKEKKIIEWNGINGIVGKECNKQNKME